MVGLRLIPMVTQLFSHPPDDGGLDSNDTVMSAVRNSFVVAMFIFFLGIFPILALAFCCWYCCRDRHQRTQLWAKILGGPKLSLPYVFTLPSSIANQIVSLARRWLKKATRPSPTPLSAKSVAECESIGTVLMEKSSLDIRLPGRAEERLQNADDPSHGAKEKKPKKGREIRLEVITVTSSPKAKLKSFGVASERLITEHVDISPVSSPEVRSASPSPKFARRLANDPSVKREPKKDFRDWVKDQVHLKIAAFKRNVSGDGPSSPDVGVATAAIEALDLSESVPHLVVTPADQNPPRPNIPSQPIPPTEYPDSPTSSAAEQMAASANLPKLVRSPPPPPPPFVISKPSSN